MGISADHLTLADGSGLSRLNLITPKSAVKLLNYMRRQDCGECFFQTLPIAGVDGTLKGRMRHTAAQGKIHAKTGLIDKVRALSGYALTQDGEELAFSMIVNFYSGPTGLANQIQDLVCERMANFKR
jgi:serine-type D-Ala-D-Ala carboxypeptidase/endopeptidase (penicillin-binding protein 4)